MISIHPRDDLPTVSRGSSDLRPAAGRHWVGNLRNLAQSPSQIALPKSPGFSKFFAVSTVFLLQEDATVPRHTIWKPHEASKLRLEYFQRKRQFLFAVPCDNCWKDHRQLTWLIKKLQSWPMAMTLIFCFQNVLGWLNLNGLLLIKTINDITCPKMTASNCPFSWSQTTEVWIILVYPNNFQRHPKSPKYPVSVPSGYD